MSARSVPWCFRTDSNGAALRVDASRVSAFWELDDDPQWQ